MTKANTEHFNSYRHQTRIKHQILEKYLPVYWGILGSSHKNLVYFDGFAGPGQYQDAESGEIADGSPIRALNLIAHDANLAEHVFCLFVEVNQQHFKELEQRVRQFFNNHSHIKEPVLINATFKEAVEELKKNIEEHGKEIAPTFLFVDPCGVAGADMASVAEIASREQCEAFIFFNIDGVRRIAGLKEDQSGTTLRDLLGSEQRVSVLRQSLNESSDPAEKEHIILRAYMESLQEDAGTPYILPFRIESDQRHTTSHYLIHATKHPLGFKIMKDIMWDAGRLDEDDEPGRMELLQRTSGDLSSLMRVDLEAADQAILQHLQENGLTSAKVFIDEWPERPADLYTSKVYRQRILDLESSGQLVVVDQDQATVRPARERRNTRSGPALKRNNRYYFVRLAE